MKIWYIILFTLPSVFGQKYLIPMDILQTDHLKAYGIVHMIIKKGITVEWLLNYRGGSFMITHNSLSERQCKKFFDNLAKPINTPKIVARIIPTKLTLMVFITPVKYASHLESLLV